MGNNEKHWALGVLTTCVLNRREEGEQDPECGQLRGGGKVMGGHSLTEFRWLSCRLLPRGATCIFRMTLKHMAAEQHTNGFRSCGSLSPLADGVGNG